MFDFDKELKKLPDSPGVYIMHDAKDKIIYVGKAKSLTKRVHQYFRDSYDEGIKKNQMIKKIASFEYIITDSELEALILECNLIKEHRPKYNTMLRDDKTYPYIKVTLGEAYPRVLFVRKVIKDKSLYFGPFSSSTAVRETIDFIQKYFKIRICNRDFPKMIGKKKACLAYHLKTCDGICLGQISEDKYKKYVDKAVSFLNGNNKDIIKDLTDKMINASTTLNFEDAKRYRDLIQSIEFCSKKQKITDSNDLDQDIISYASDSYVATIVIFFIRGGKMIGRDHFFLRVSNDKNGSDILRAFIGQFYSDSLYIPHEIYIEDEIEDRKILEELFKNRKGQKVYIKTAKIGKKKKLLDLAKKNAFLVLQNEREKYLTEEKKTIGAMKELRNLLGIDDIVRLEAYDISNTSGKQSVGSMVVFYNGKPKKSDYRKFKIKTVEGPNDYASMREVLTRRFKKGLDINKSLKESLSIKDIDNDTINTDIKDSFSSFPDVIMMDGGRGQVNIALSVLKELKLDIPVCGMVKDDHHRTRGLFYKNKELPIDKRSEVFKMIERLQDEAHRFAIEYHRLLRGKSQLHSFLDDIKGIGKVRKKALIREYSSIYDMKDQSIDDFLSIPEMNKEVATNLYNYLHTNKEI